MSFSQDQLDWFKQIFFERFGIGFIFECAEDTVLLRVDGSEKIITFSNIDIAFYKFGETNLNCYEWDAKKESYQGAIASILRAPSTKELMLPIINLHANGAVINYDILGLAYWMLNRLEEVGRTDLDNHERFSAKSSHAWKNNYLNRPIVDEWLEILKQVIQHVWPNLKIKEHKFQLNITHDVDRPARFGFANPINLVKSVLGDVIKRKDLSSLFLGPYIRFNTEKELHTKDPFNTFEWIMDVSERNSVKSAFYFICGSTDQTKDADYTLQHPAIQKLLMDIHARGHEIGLHPSYNCYKNKEALAQEFTNLKETCRHLGIQQSEWGGRMHFLRWKHPETMLYWNECGLSYDSTLGYADYAGFRAGSCHEYTAFDPVGHKVLNLKIKPLIAMECTVLHDRYMAIDENPLEVFLELKEKCQKVNGVFTLLWHNSEFTKEAYRSIYQGVF
ncbi:polysaccharide deacetylase family protein [Acinetobacter sp. NIPH 2699]|uniref:polysaccharide deacetylase family protein n=1 Tax=Acinetobacter sp. NIPH 2699 TaxID=2923433 RepID=UPI001F4A11AF|nr:polysaccharide deacetylase family protein [Acinetobacter sp. NIPH 2699]MCH7337299.1 polysaccharide deacetylase family protein [Acinetobacter sp. NIPH 2699]